MKTVRKQATLKASKIRRILVPFDFSEHSSNALRQAIFMAKGFKASIDLLHVVAPVYATPNYAALMPTDDIFYVKLLKSATKNLEKIAKEIEAKEGVTIHCKASLNVIHKEILKYSIKRKSDLIIMGTHGTSGVSEFFAGSNAYRVVNESQCPVITVQIKSNDNGFKKIVLPIRAELNSRQKVNLAATLAKTFEAKIYITGYTDGSNTSEKQKVTNYVKQVEGFLKRESITYESTIIEDSNFTKSIIEHAKKTKADLIAVMTTHDFSFNQSLIGSYAQQFVNHSKIPVLSVPNTLNFEYSYSNPLLGGMTSYSK